MKTTRAFTLIELLVVVAIITVLVALCVPLTGILKATRDRAAALNKFRELGSGMLTYSSMHDDEFPSEGEGEPTWASATGAESKDAWYNAIPRLLGKPGVGDYSMKPASYYHKDNLLYIPAAAYPNSKTSRPYFAVSICSKLRRKGQETARMLSIQNRARTVIFQESGLPGENLLPGQTPDKYDGQSKSYASRTVARYDGKTLMLFADGHAEFIDAREVVNPSGQAYFPQVGPTGGAVYWTNDPEADAND